MNIALLLENAARSFPSRPAVTLGTRPLFDYAAMMARVGALASALQGVLEPGDRVAVASPNCPEYLEILYAVWRCGGVAAPLNAQLHGAELAYATEDCAAKLVFAGNEIAERLSRQLPKQRIIDIGGGDYKRMLNSDIAPIVPRGADEPAWIFYTSGTTGKPKGAVLSHGNLTAMLLAYFADVDFIDTSDALLHFAATSHASGLFALSFVAKAANNILPESGKYDPSELVDISAKIPRLTFFVPPTVLRRMCRSDASRAANRDNVKTVIVGAAPVYESDIRAGFSLFGPKLWNGYGQGESPCTITAMSKRMISDALQANDVERLTSVGVARTGVEIRIDSGTKDGVGEILVRADTVMKGYWGNDSATRAALRDGWLHTGDLGRMDRFGFLTLLDRQKDMIISGGQNVYAREVEDVLLSHNGVEEAAVIGVADADWGERVVAVVAAAHDHSGLAAELDALCIERIARFKRPKSYVFVDSLPKNASGKVLKNELRHAFGDTPARERISSQENGERKDRQTIL